MRQLSHLGRDACDHGRIGLVAAIPSVIAYNRFSNTVNRFEARLFRFADRFHATLSRRLEMEA